MLDWLAWVIHALSAGAAIAFIRLRRRGRIAARWTLAESLIAIGCAAALLALTSGPVLIDYTKAYHYAGQAILTNPASLYDCTRAQCYVNLPILALLFAPLGSLEPYTAGVLFSLAGLAALALAARRMTAAGPFDTVAWLILLNGPLYYSIRIGNTTHVLLIVLLVAFERLSRNRDRLAGALLAVAALIKPPLAIFLFYLALRGRVRAAFTMAAVAAAAVLVSVALYGLDLHVFWFREFVVGHGSAPVAAYNVQSVNGFLAHLVTRGHLRDWYPIPMGAAFRAASLLLTAIIAAAAIGTCWRAGRPRSSAAWFVELSLVLATSLLVAPITWTHYYLLLLVPIAGLLAPRTWPDRPIAQFALACGVILISPPVVLLPLAGRIPAALYSRVLVSHYFYGGVLLLGVLIAVRLKVAAAEDEPASPASMTGPATV